MGLFRRIGRVFRSVTRVVSGVVGGVVKSAVGLATGLAGAALGALRKFGPLAAMAGFAGAFLGLPLALMSPHVLGALHSLFGGCRSPQELSQACHQCCNSPAYNGCPAAPYNVAQMVAYRHAQIAFAQQYQASMQSMGYYG